MRKKVVCISLVTAAGGEAAGRMVAERLGYRFFDEEVIALAAAKGNVDPRLVADVEKRTSLIHRLVDVLFASPVLEGHYFPITAEHAGVKPHAVPQPTNREELRALIREAIHAIAERGNAVIVAHAASFALGPKPDALRVMITAGMKTRAQRLWLSGKFLSEEQAELALAESDRERAHYLQRFYDVRAELPTHYDVAINTDTLSVEEAAALIVATARG